jgi:hypothetical protein
MPSRDTRDPVEKTIGEVVGECLELLVFLLIQLVVGLTDTLSRSLQSTKPVGAGVAIGRYRWVRISIPRRDRMMHAHVMGATGSGKTWLLVNMARRDMDARQNEKPVYGVGVIDPKGDLVDRLLGHIPWHRRGGGDVIVFDPTDTDKPLGFNILENVPPELRSRTTSQVVSIFKKLFGQSWGPRLEHILRFAVLTLLEVPGSTLADIPRLLLEEDFRQGVLPHVTNSQVINFWQHEYKALAKGRDSVLVVEPILNKIGPWIAYPEVNNVIDQVQSSFDLRQVMDQKKIFLARLPEGLLGEDTRQILGALLITRFQLGAASRADIPESQRAPFILYVDEFQNFVTEASEKIITEGRSFGLGLVVANQHKGQFREQLGLLEALERNVAAQIFLYKDGKKYRVQYARPQERVPPDWEAPVRQLTPLRPPSRRAGAEQIIEDSRSRYGRDRDWVEADIWRRRGHTVPPSGRDDQRESQEAPFWGE